MSRESTVGLVHRRGGVVGLLAAGDLAARTALAIGARSYAPATDALPTASTKSLTNTSDAPIRISGGTRDSAPDDDAVDSIAHTAGVTRDRVVADGNY